MRLTHPDKRPLNSWRKRRRTVKARITASMSNRRVRRTLASAEASAWGSSLALNHQKHVSRHTRPARRNTSITRHNSNAAYPHEGMSPLGFELCSTNTRLSPRWAMLVLPVRASCGPHGPFHARAARAQPGRRTCARAPPAARDAGAPHACSRQPATRRCRRHQERAAAIDRPIA